jgi:protoheme IX farnesyltransferase
MVAPAVSPSVPFSARLGGFVALTKPRIIELLLITTVPTMVVAEGGLPSVWLMVATVIGGAFAAGGANAINMVVDRDIDARMERTQNRPLVTGVVSPRAALVFALGLEVVAFVWLTLLVNLLSAVLALSACLFYVFVYTLWLKRNSPQNIVIGGAAGAVPVLIGWSAVTNEVSVTALLLFGVIFAWTPPHFWALAIRYRDDYAGVDVPMLPVVADDRSTVRQMVAYSVVVLGLSLAVAVTASLGPIYWVTAAVLGGAFTWRCAALAKDASPRRAMGVFTFSITYLTVVFVVMAVDVLVRNGL